MNQTATEYLPSLLIDNFPDMVTMIDRDGKIVFFNPSAQGVFKIDSHSLTINKVLGLIHFSDRKNILRIINENIREKKRSFNVEFRYRSNKSEKWKWIESKGKIVSGTDKRIHFIINSRDTTNIKTIVQELGLHKNASMQTGNGIIITAISNTNSKIIFANEEFCKLFHLPMNKVLGKKHSDVLSLFNSDKNLYYNIINQIRSNKKYQNEHSFHPPSGESLCYLLEAFPLVSDNKKTITHFVTTYIDITEKAKKEKLLDEKNKELNTFVYKACHDLKGPLASIAGLSNLGIEQVKDKQANELFSIIKESVIRLDVVLNELLFLSNIEHGKSDFKKVDIVLVIDQIIESYQFSEVFDCVNFKFNYNSKNKIISDPINVKSVIQNIIDNALKYKNCQLPVTEIFIETIDYKEGILLSITDNGVGIEETQLKKIFEMFYRGNTNSKGTGLGLYMVKKSLEKLGGNISVESQINKGSKFIIYLPNKNNKNE